MDWRTLRDAAAHSLSEGRLDEAETRYLQARQAAEAAGASDEEMSDLLLDLLDVLTSQEKHDDATQVGEAWLAALERIKDPNREGHRRTVASSNGQRGRLTGSVAAPVAASPG